MTIRLLALSLGMLFLGSVSDVFAQRATPERNLRARATRPSCRVSCGTAAMVIDSPGVTIEKAPQFHGCTGDGVTPPMDLTIRSSPDGAGTLLVEVRSTAVVAIVGLQAEPHNVGCYGAAKATDSRGAVQNVNSQMAVLGGSDLASVTTRESQVMEACGRINIECRNSGQFRYGAPGVAGRNVSPKSPGKPSSSSSSESAESAPGSAGGDPAHE